MVTSDDFLGQVGTSGGWDMVTSDDFLGQVGTSGGDSLGS
jgi:hypothetical protein